MSEPGLSYGYELQFRLRFAEGRGTEFQDFFNNLMERRDPGFRRVRPWGNQGDRKNDGWSPASRTLFQVYAPARFKASDLATKLTEDFDGAVDYWEQHFDTWVFVHNDVDGLAPEVELKVAELDQRNENITCTSWGREQIRRELVQFQDADLTALLGPPITAEQFLSVSAASLQPLFEHLEVAALNPDSQGIGPVPVDKIERNGLGDAQTRLLTLGEVKMQLVDEYLTRVSPRPTYKSDVSGVFAAKYEELHAAFDGADDIFDNLLAWLTAGVAEAHRLVNAVTVLAYFFFTCQIFEEEGL